jgi:predicted unusual protein kinase regulating ubiquinone biosynthesis (AarF/ABC1/UbiB family)
LAEQPDPASRDVPERQPEPRQPEQPEHDVPRGRLGRSLPLVSLAARSAGAAALGRGPRGTRIAPVAERYADLLGRSRGALMKAGQLMSFVAVGPAGPEDQRAVYQAAFSRLQDSAPPMPGEEAVAVAEAELDRPLDAAFAEFGPRPIAAASIGQVHAARLLNGREVAVKIQYPGVAEAIRDDLRNGELLAAFLQLGRGLTCVRADMIALAKEISERIAQELDYRAEARHHAEFAAAYHDHPLIRIPAIVPELCTSRLLTMDLAHGRRWAQALTAPAALRDRWGEVIFRFAVGSLRRLGLVNADPHPGNYLFHDDGGVTFLDFGCVKRYAGEQVAVLEAAVQAAVDSDAGQLSRVLVAGGFTDRDQQPEPGKLLCWLREALTPVIAPQPFTYTPEFAAALAQADLSRSSPHADVIRRLTVPADFVSIARVNLEVTAVLGALRATGEWEAIRREQDVSRPGPQP